MQNPSPRSDDLASRTTADDSYGTVADADSYGDPVALDPEQSGRGLLARLAEAARATALGNRMEQRLKAAEHRVLHELRARMTQLGDDAGRSADGVGSGGDDGTGRSAVAGALGDGSNAASGPGASAGLAFADALAANASRARAARKPSALMAELLARAQQQTREQAQEALLRATLDLLTPDEARILAALSDGSRFPVLHVLQAPLLGAAQPVLENASTVGRAAGVRLPERTPVYLGRLRTLGLVEFGPEESGLREKYEILQTDAAVLEALRTVEETRRSNARLLRRSVALSAFGRELWEQAHRPFTVGAGDNSVALSRR